MAEAQVVVLSALRAGHPVGMVIEHAPMVRLQGLPGMLRRVVGSEASGGDGTEGPVSRWLWEGASDGPGLVALLRSMMVHGRVPCDVDGRPHRARAIGCWYDAGRGTVVVEFAERPEPVA